MSCRPESSSKLRGGLIPTNWYIVTGAPSSGITSLTNRLALLGYYIVPEAARAIIDEGISQGKTIEEIRCDEVGFQNKVLREKDELETRIPLSRLAFFVRGKEGDTLAYWLAQGQLTPSRKDTDWVYGSDMVLQRRYRYRNPVFLLGRLPFRPDYARTENEELAQLIHKCLWLSYGLLGHQIIEVPVAPVSERAQFVLDHIPASLRRRYQRIP